MDFRPYTARNAKLCVGQCEALPGYRAGIAVENQNRGKLYFDEIIHNMVDHEKVHRATAAMGTQSIYFKNGSLLEIFVASENACRRKFDELIIEPQIRQEIVWNVLAHLVMPMYLRKWWGHQTHEKKG